MALDRIDFQSLKRQASFDTVLARYGLPPLSRGTGRCGGGRQHFILCPLHRESEPSCLIDHARNRFHCFGCGTGGSILDFVAWLENCSIRRAAAIVAECCGLAGAEGAASVGADAETNDGAKEGAAAAVNEPLGYRLRLDPSHPYLASRGLTEEVIERFGLGFCDRGRMRGRIAIPIHDEAGRLVAYAGRWAAADVPKDQPRYLLPRGFRKQRVLFNLHRAAGAPGLIIVESYWSVFRLAALGVPAAGLMGRDLSPTQLSLLVDAGIDHVQLMLDGDPPGRSASATIVPALARRLFVKILDLPDGMKPHSAPEDLLRRLIGLP